MEKGKRTEPEFLLPEAIIQHIQSFLSGKQAAQTSILSKSWYSAWSTRPNLDFDQWDFLRNVDEKGFWKSAKKTMRRYEELNLKIESFRLFMNGAVSGSDNPKHFRYSFAKELIVKAIKMGASDLNFKVLHETSKFVLPHEVLGSKTLIRLSVNGCKIDLGADGKVSCLSLKSLSLHRVFIEGDIIWDIISSCPLIEEMLLCKCMCLFELQTSKGDGTITRMLALSPFIEFGRKNVVGSAVDSSIIKLYMFHNLKYLRLEHVKIDALFFRDFSSKFPCLKELTLDQCLGSKQVQISSVSLERIRIVQVRMLRAKFDVPSIREFSFESSELPSLTFETASREWESDISVTCLDNLSTSWFLGLKKFLAKLSPSKISLSLIIGYFLEKSFDCPIDVQGLPKPIVENLKLSMEQASAVCSALLDGLFWSFRPKFITQHLLPKSCKWDIANRDLLELLCKTLIIDVSENCYIPNRNMFGLHDLEAVNVQLFEETLAEWRPLPWSTLLDASNSLENKQKIRFRLRWGCEPK